MRLFSSSVLGVLPLVAVALLTGLLLPAASMATVQEVAVVPQQPSRCDSVIFHAAGYFPDGCWHYDGYDVSILPVMSPSDPGPMAVPMTVYMMRIFSHHYENTPCPLVIVPYGVSHPVGMLRPGLYGLIVVEVDSQDSSRVYDQRQITFTVRDSCGPVEACVMPGFTPSERGCNATVLPGTPGFLTVTLRNSMPIAGAEIVVDGFQQLGNLPCGQGILCDWRLAVTRVEPLMRAADMGVEWAFKDGRLHLMLHPLSMLDNAQGLGIIEPGEGPIARIWVQILSDTLSPTSPIPEYDLQVVLEPVAFADEQARTVPACPTFAPITGTVCIRNTEKCDINADGRSDVVDIVNMIKCIMCTIPEGCCTPEQVLRADCNGDGVLNVNDVVCCIRYILGSFCFWCDTGQGVDQGSASPASIGLSDNVSWESDTRFTVPITFSSPVGTGGVEARIEYDPQVLSVDKIAIPTELDGAELYYTVSGGKLSLMVVAMGDNPLPFGDGGVLAQVSFAFVPGSKGQLAEILMEGAAGADKQGNRLDLLKTNVKVAIEPQVAPAVPLASKPNPFLSSTDVSLSITSGQEGSLSIYDVAGRLVKTLYRGYLSGGAHTFKWDGRGSNGFQVPSGIYFVKFEGKNNSLTGKLVFLRSQ
jgi:hypothetical protein